MTIFAKLDVTIWSHEKVLAAGAAPFGMWAACLAYLRQHESSDGHVKVHVVGQFFGLGRQESVKLCEKLVEVGLFERHPDGGYLLLRYAEHNETKEAIDTRREQTRTRVETHRRNRTGSDGNAVGNALPNHSGNASVPDSGSVSGSDPSEGVTGERRSPRNAADDGAFGMAVAAWCDGVRSVTGHEFLVPRGKPTETLVAAILSRAPDSAGRIDWARSAGAEWVKAARAGDSKLSVYGFVDWLNAGQPKVLGRGTQKQAVETPQPEAKPAQPAPDAVTDQAVIGENLRKLRETLSGAGVPPWEAP